MKKTYFAIVAMALFGAAYAGSMDINLSAVGEQGATPAPASSAAPAAAPRTTAAAPAIPAQPSASVPAASTAVAVATKPAVSATTSKPAVVVNSPTVQLPLHSQTQATPVKGNAPKASVSTKTQETRVAESTPAPQANLPGGTTGTPVAAASGAVGVNPFTGTNLGVEELQRRLEQAKSETQLLEEKLKQATLVADMENLPAKKRAEVAQLKGQDKVGEALPMLKANAQPSAKAVPKHPVKPVHPAAAPAVEVTRPASAPLELSGVIVDNGAATAVLTINGNTSLVPNGGMTPYGPLKVLSTSTAQVGGALLHVHNETLARVKISDPKPVDPKAPMAMPAAVFPPAANAKSPTLPPIPLPPST